MQRYPAVAMKRFVTVFAPIIMLASVISAQTKMVPLNQWVRTVDTDALTGRSSVQWTFGALQKDGRRPYIFLVCYPDNPKKNAVGYFADTDIYEDLDAETSASMASGIVDTSRFFVPIHYRGTDRKIYRAEGKVATVNPKIMILDQGILAAFGGGGQLVIQFPTASGYNATDVFQQQPQSHEDYHQLSKDCFPSKHKSR